MLQLFVLEYLPPSLISERLRGSRLELAKIRRGRYFRRLVFRADRAAGQKASGQCDGKHHCGAHQSASLVRTAPGNGIFSAPRLAMRSTATNRAGTRKIPTSVTINIPSITTEPRI